MLKASIIGNLGSAAELKESQGRKFTTFKVAHNNVWTGEDGVEHRETIWVDCIINDHPKIVQYLLSGTCVYVEGSISLRVYSSAKDRCMKAGMTIRVQHIELVGGRADLIPSRLYDKDGVEVPVTKWYLTDRHNEELMSQRGGMFRTDQYGWVSPVKVEEDTSATATNQEQSGTGNDGAQVNESADVDNATTTANGDTAQSGKVDGKANAAATNEMSTKSKNSSKKKS